MKYIYGHTIPNGDAYLFIHSINDEVDQDL